MRQPDPPTPAVGEGPSTSGAAASSGGKGGGITLQGDELKAFLAHTQAGGGLQAALGGAGRAGVPPPQFEEVAEEEGTAQPKHATVDDPEFSKYWKAPIAGGRVQLHPGIAWWQACCGQRLSVHCNHV